MSRWRALELRVPPLLLTGAVAGLMAATAWALPGWNRPFAGQHAVALAAVAGGLGVMVAGAWQFRRQGTTLDPRDPTRTHHIVDGGVYRLTRNPMYLGMAVALLGVAAWWGSVPGLAWVAGFCAYLTVFQIQPEERLLRKRFGAGYEAYQARVRRWL